MSSSSSSSSSSSTTRPYVVINLDKMGKGNAKPFKNALQAPDSTSKTLHNTFFYVFTAQVDGSMYWKIGETYDEKTYHSKNRFCPMVDYDGQFQILHYGRMVEKLVVAYMNDALNQSYKGSEWYTNAQQPLDALRAALSVNKRLFADDARQMTNIRAFPQKSGYTSGATKTTEDAIDAYLSLFRVRYKNSIYLLTHKNVEMSIHNMTQAEFLVDGPPAPAVPPIKGITAAVQDAFESEEDTGEEDDDAS